jgi:glycerol uptake facilitator-like aquaporin
MIFGEYFPNPAIFGTGPDAAALVSPLAAMLVEALGTAILVLVIFALSDPENAAAPEPTLVPFLIGFTVAVLISLFAPITQAGWNPARDFGPRLVAVLAGFGSVAIPGPQGGFWIYIVGPLIGGVVGGLFYERLIGPLLPRKRPSGVEEAFSLIGK